MSLLCKLFGHKILFNEDPVDEFKTCKRCGDKVEWYRPQAPQQMDCVTWYNAITKKPYMVQDINTYNRLRKLNDMLDGIL